MSENHTKAILDELYKFMGIPYDLKAQNNTLEYLMHGESQASHRKYVSLFRDRDFDPNHWTKELSGEVNITNLMLLAKCLNSPFHCCSKYLMLRSGAVELFKSWITLLSMLQLHNLPHPPRLVVKPCDRKYVPRMNRMLLKAKE